MSSGILRAVARAHNTVVDVMAAIAMAALAIMAVMIAAHVVMRGTIGSGVRGVNEWSQYLLVGVVYAGLAVSLRDGSFIRVQLLIDRLGARAQALAIRLVAVVSLAFMSLLSWQSWVFALDALRNGTESIGVLEAPLWIPQSLVAIGSTALTLQLLAIAVNPSGQLVDRLPKTDGASTAINPDAWRAT